MDISLSVGHNIYKRKSNLFKQEEWISDKLIMPDSCQKIWEVGGYDNILLEQKLLEPKKVTINVISHALDYRLSHIQQAILDAKYILNLPENWNDSITRPILESTFNSATNFLVNYAKHLLEIDDFVIASPQISPLNDGSIDMDWNVGDSSFLINISGSKKNVGFYYGELGSGEKKFDVNGQVPTNTLLDFVALWFKYLPKMGERTNFN